MGLPCSANGPGRITIALHARGASGLHLCYEIKYLTRNLWRAEWKQCIRKDPLPHKTCSDSTPQELAFKKKIKTQKVTNPAARGHALQPSWSLPLLFFFFFFVEAGGEALSRVWSAKRLQALPPFPLALPWEARLFSIQKVRGAPIPTEKLCKFEWLDFNH